MADPAYNGGGLIGFDETTTGGNTNSGNNSSTPNPPKSPPPPIPTPPKQIDSPPPKQQSTNSDKVSSVSKILEKLSNKPAEKNIRQRIVEDEIQKQVVGNFEKNGSIRLSGEFPQNYVDVPTYDLSKIIVIENPEVTFDFILCLKDGEESIPKLYATKIFYDILISEYNDSRPFGVNDVIEEQNIVVIDLKPLKEKVEVLRNAELSINLNRNEINGQVEVKRNLFVHSNYDVGEDGVLIANPTYDFIELLKYISWVVTKPAANYDDRLIPATDLGDFQSFPKELPDEDEPSDTVDDTVDDNDNPVDDNDGFKEDPDAPDDPGAGRFPPIGRRGVEPGETVLFNNIYYEWDAENQKWIVDETFNGENPEDDSTPGGDPPNDNGNNGNGNTGGSGNNGGPGSGEQGGPAIRD